MIAPCNFFWGSHGCDLPAGSHSIHRCILDEIDDVVIPCCEYDESAPTEIQFRQFDEDTGTWDVWGFYGLKGWRRT